MFEKRIVKRRSNWYIYLISFVTTFIILFLVILAMKDVLFPVPGGRSNLSASGVYDARPSVSFNKNFLFMLSESKGGIPDYFFITNYRPRDDIVIIVPLDKNLYYKVRSVEGDFSHIYEKLGVSGIKTAVSGILNLNIDNYFKFDKNSFIEFLDLIGTVTVNIPYDLTENGNVVFKAGTHQFNGTEVYSYATFPGNDDVGVILSTIMSGFINENSQGKSAAEIQSYVKKIINTTNTDYKFDEFTKNQSAYLYTSKYSYNIAENYVPLYNREANGFFSISPNSVSTIKDRFSLSE